MKTFDQMLRAAGATGRHRVRRRQRAAAVREDRQQVRARSTTSPRSTDAILEMLTRVGGAPYVKDLEKNPAHWTTRVDGVGSVGVQAVFVIGRASGPLRRDRAGGVAGVRRPAGSRRRGARARAAAAVAARDRPARRAARRGAREHGASDVHVVAGRPVLVRVAGELAPRRRRRSTRPTVERDGRARSCPSACARRSPSRARATSRSTAARSAASASTSRGSARASRAASAASRRSSRRSRRSACRPRSSARRTTTRASSWSPARPGTARRARSRRSSTSSTARPRTTSSRSRTRSSTCTRASGR